MSQKLINEAAPAKSPATSNIKFSCKCDMNVFVSYSRLAVWNDKTRKMFEHHDVDVETGLYNSVYSNIITKSAGPSIYPGNRSCSRLCHLLMRHALGSYSWPI